MRAFQTTSEMRPDDADIEAMKNNPYATMAEASESVRAFEAELRDLRIKYRITDLHLVASCPCVDPELVHEAREAGEEGECAVMFTAAAGRGSRQRQMLAWCAGHEGAVITNRDDMEHGLRQALLEFAARESEKDQASDQSPAEGAEPAKTESVPASAGATTEAQ